MALGTGAFQAGTNYPGLLWDILKFGGAKLPAQAHTNIPVASTATVWSNSFKLNRGMTYGWEVAFTSSGVCTVTATMKATGVNANIVNATVIMVYTASSNTFTYNTGTLATKYRPKAWQ